MLVCVCICVHFCACMLVYVYVSLCSVCAYIIVLFSIDIIYPFTAIKLFGHLSDKAKRFLCN